MEPVTHVLTGACLARTGLNRRTAYATVAMAIAAEFPDIDTLWSLRGPVAGFAHHRGITHTLLGLPLEAGLILLGFYVFDRLRPTSRRARIQRSDAPTSPRDPVPVRWGVLYGLAFLALLSHLALDYTNNYGVRPFFPFNPRWYAGSFVFIFDPLIFLLLVAGLLLPLLFGLIGREVGSGRARPGGRGWPAAALLGILLLWSVRSFEHRQAVALGQVQSLRTPGALDGADSAEPPNDEGSDSPAQPAPQDVRALLLARRSLASPDPLSVFRWYTATDFGPAVVLGVADTHIGTLTPGAVLAKPQPSPGLLAAERSPLGRVYLDWSPMPILTVSSGLAAGADVLFSDSRAAETVTFTDPRFMGDTPWLRRGDRVPLTGTVVVDASGRVLAEGMDGRFGR